LPDTIATAFGTSTFVVALTIREPTPDSTVSEVAPGVVRTVHGTSAAPLASVVSVAGTVPAVVDA
jgi:hypothetical protein